MFFNIGDVLFIISVLVILTQLSGMSAFTSHMTNQTRKVDMALALLEAFSNVIYSPLSKHVINSAVLPGLR